MKYLWLLVALLFLACGQENTNNAPPKKTTLQPTEDHQHPSPHGGMVATSDDKHIELKISTQGHIDVYLLDHDVKPISSINTTGTIKITLPAGVQELTLAPHDDHLAAQGPTLDLGGYYTCEMHPELREESPGKCPKCGMELIKKSSIQKLIALVELDINKKPYSARFDYKMNAQGDATPHQHDSRQGGQVVMAGQDHIELTTPNPGEYNVFLSNDRRAPLPASSAKQPSITVDPDAEKPEVLTLAADPTDAFLQAKGAPPIKNPVEVKVEFMLNGEKVAVSFLVGAPK
jgi:hypothetical protein